MEHDSASCRNKNVAAPPPQLTDAQVNMWRHGEWKGEIQSTQETEHAIPVMKRPRERNPGACQFCNGARELVDDQYPTLHYAIGGVPPLGLKI